ncbi:MAG: GNAT family N-acetyltransferase [Acidimicrobiia bacterium]|nr:GNAT family N-acetyltransferase [Acidimicrobiia bacterium]
MDIALVEITADNLRAVMDLKVKPSQDDFVAPNSVSIAQKCFDDESWMRAIYAGDDPVGFVLLSERRNIPRYYLWRYMIDADHQGKGYGAAGMDLLVEYVRTLPNATELFLSYVPAPDGPRDFYARVGFADTGREEGGEREMRLEL